VDRQGRVNLAPFSFFNAVAYVPPQVMFATTGPHREGGPKHSLDNIRETGEFVVNLATWPLRGAVNASSVPAPAGIDEFEVAGLTKAPARLVRPPLVVESPVHLECRLVTVVELPTPDPEDPNSVVFGEVVGVHIADRAIADGRVDVLRLDPIARLGYDQYMRVTEVFSMQRPGWPP
jgi:flavin reductase (DIM6/NTAB) family NADH-FMN oxidoreductase RutF